jgi:hypothetical protein
MTIHHPFQPECRIMSAPSNGITFRTIQEAMPEYHIDADLLGGVLAAMPPPPPDASASWRRARLTRVIEEVAARVPMDAAQGHLAGQIVVVQFLADDTLGGLTTPGLPLAERRLATRTADDLLRSVVRLERALERRQTRVMPFRDVGAVDGFDLDALGGVWGREVPAATGTGLDSRAAAGAGDAGTVIPPVAPGLSAGLALGESAPARADGMAALVGVAAKAEGEAARAGNPDGRARMRHTGVTLERGDGWSLEVWPARAGPATAEKTMPDREMPERATVDRRMPDREVAQRAMADRRGKWGAA